MPTILDYPDFQHNEKQSLIGENSVISNNYSELEEMNNDAAATYEDINNLLPENSINGSKMSYLEVEKLKAGSVQVSTNISSSNFVEGESGWIIYGDGSAEFENVMIRGTLHSTVFESDVVSAVGGQLLVTSADNIALDMTALDASTLTLEGTVTFVNNDVLFVRAQDGGTIKEEWMHVTDASGAPTYVVTRDLAGTYAADANPAWKAGATITKLKNSDLATTHSGGYLMLFGDGTNSPYYSVFVSGGVTYNDFDEVGRMGNLNGVGPFSIDTYGIFLGDYSTRQYMTYDSASGKLRVNEASLELRAFYGDGSGGNATISAPTTLTRDMFYENLTVETGITLNTGGYRVFVRDTLALEGTGKIARNGATGTDGTNGTDATASPAGSNPGAFGVGGAGGAALAAGSLPGSLAGVAGQDGRQGVDGDGAPVVGNSGNAATAGSGQSKCIVATATAGVSGGDGGSATTTGPSAGGTAAAGGAAGTATGTVKNIPYALTPAYCLYDFVDSATLNSSPQNGGAGGSASGAARVTGAGKASSGGSGGAGGGGGQGGIVQVFARRITGSGTIEAVGGDGGDGGDAGASAFDSTGGAAAAGGSGGGAGGVGGEGGIVIVSYNFLSATISFSVAGGAGGAGGLKSAGVAGGAASANDGVDGTDGTNGNDGVVIELAN